MVTSTLWARVYVSSAVHRLPDTDLERLLRDARQFNAGAGVSGALLYHQGSFFQYLEGAPTDVDDAFRRVRASRLHHGIVELLHAPVAQRRFASWHMGFSHSSASLLLALSQAAWQSAYRCDSPADAPAVVGLADGNAGVRLLMDFWRRYGEPAQIPPPSV